MAARKRDQQRQASNPNTLIVIFLVFFVLVSVGMAGWGYFGYAGQDEIIKAVQKKKAEAEAAHKIAEFAMLWMMHTRTAVGDPFFKDDITDEKNTHDVDLQAFLKGEKYADHPLKPLLDEMIKKNKDALGYDQKAFNTDKSLRYTSNYRDKIASLQKELADLQGKLVLANERVKGLEKEKVGVVDGSKGFWEEIKGSIKEGNDKALAAAREKNETLDKVAAQVSQLKAEKDQMNIDHQKVLIQKEGLIRELQARSEALEAKLADVQTMAPKKDKEMAEPAPVAVGQATSLLLDISGGRALWDLPVGKVVKLYLNDRSVYINIGSAQGAQKMMTFNVFAAGYGGKAQGMLRATIEVYQVLDANTSVARLTSIYDNEGKQLPLSEARQSGAIQEGDLLYNLTFGTHVAVAGVVNWNGYASYSPADQMRHLREFQRALVKEGAHLDAHIDLTTGGVVGRLTAQTRFLILGEPIVFGGAENRVADNKGEGADKDKEKEKEKMDAMEGEGSLSKTINEQMLALKKEAQDRGIFIISAENFAVVIGHRRPRSANEQVSDFRPRVPSVSSGRPAVLGERLGGEKKIDP